MSNEKINNVNGVEKELNRSNNSLIGSGGTSMEEALKSAFKGSADGDFSITIVKANSKKISLEDPGNGELYVAGMPSVGDDLASNDLLLSKPVRLNKKSDVNVGSSPKLK